MHKIKCIKRECQAQKLQAVVLKNEWCSADFFCTYEWGLNDGNNEDDNGKWKYNLD